MSDEENKAFREWYDLNIPNHHKMEHATTTPWVMEWLRKAWAASAENQRLNNPAQVGRRWES